VRIAPFTAYLVAVSGWFFSFGLQTTTFPGVINYTLNESPERLGLRPSGGDRAHAVPSAAGRRAGGTPGTGAR
jgi:hypothetical protein